jgi:hypothetical protein
VAAGIQRASLGADAAIEDFNASAYLTGPLFGAQNPTLLNGERVGFIGRLAARPYHDEDWNLHAGFPVRPCSIRILVQAARPG